MAANRDILIRAFASEEEEEEGKMSGKLCRDVEVNVGCTNIRSSWAQECIQTRRGGGKWMSKGKNYITVICE